MAEIWLPIVTILTGGLPDRDWLVAIQKGCVTKLAEHCGEVRNRLDKAIETYFSATSALESRVLLPARRLRDLQIAADPVEIANMEPVDHASRARQAPELSGPASDAAEKTLTR
jgi:hypothetical protein